ncbi:MAG: phage minor capsid protein [Bacilli bacterium]
MSLSPSQLDNIPNSMVALYQGLEDYIIKDFARRVNKTGTITSTAEWMAIRAEEIGIATKHINEEIERLVAVTIDELDILFKDSALASMNSDNKIFEAGRLDRIKIEEHPALKEYLNAAIAQTKGELINITRSLGFAEIVNGKIVYKDIAKMYHNQLDLAQMKVSTGVSDYNSAIRQAVKKITDSGLRYIDYENGWSNRVDVAVRRSVLTSVNQMSQKMTEYNISELGLELVEVSAHAGARPNHAEWHGQIYSYKGNHEKYPDLVEATGYGTGEGLGGYNCRHSFFPYLDGTARTYTDKYLQSLNDKTVEYEDKQYTDYEASQYQRKLERSMRQTKRELIAYKEAGLDKDFTNASIKLQQQKRKYEDFSKAARIRQKNDRTQVQGFDRSIAQKSVWASKRGDN